MTIAAVQSCITELRKLLRDKGQEWEGFIVVSERQVSEKYNLEESTRIF